MKKAKKYVGILATLALVFGAIGCSSDDGEEAKPYSEPYYPIESISIQNFDAEISINNEYTVVPEITPSNATNKEFTITVTSTDGNAIDWVTVNGTTIKPTDEGSFRLTITSKANARLSDTKVIISKPIALSNISLTSNETFYVGRTVTLSPTFTPENASYKNVTWASSDETVATVDKFGIVSGVKEGTTKITATSEKYPTIKAELNIEVKPVLPTKMSLKANSLSAQAGGACTIATVFEPQDTTDKSVTYESSDPTNFSVSENGVVTLSEGATGNATITVKSVANSSLTATATVKMISGNVYKINEEDTEKGFVTTNGTIKDFGSSYKGYDGKVIDSLGSNGYVVYSVASTEEQDVQVLLHYAFWGTRTELRGAYIVVNGAQDNEIIYCNWTSKNGTNDNIATYNADGTTPATYHSIWEDSNEITVHLDKGENQIRVIPVPAGTAMPNAKYPSSVTISDISNTTNYLKAGGNLPNIDYLQITGTGLGAGSNSLAFYSVSTSGDFGSVTLDPNQEFFKEGATIKLVPSANSGYKFDAYSGRTTNGTLIGSANENYTFQIYDDYSIEGHFIPTSYTADSEMTGYATLTADDTNASYTISGGAGGEIISIDTLADLTSNEDKLKSAAPYIVKFTSGSRICTSDNKSIICKIGSNKTIYGATAGAGLKNIEMRVEGNNVIIRNLILGEVIAYDTLSDYAGSGNDALSLNGARHVWVDHCELRSNTRPLDINGNVVSNPNDSDFAKDWYDGLLDIKNGGTWITISNCYFHDHYKAVLCGSGDDGPDTNSDGYSDSDMRVTFNGNYFLNVNARMPLFRYGKAHIYGSYFDAGTFSGGASCINCRAGSELYIEGNNFIGIKSNSYTIGFYYADSSKKYGNTSGTWKAINNNTANGGSSSFSVPYTYTAPASYPTSAPTDKGATLTGLNY